MTQPPDAVRAHYEAGIADEDALLARLEAALDGMEGPITADRLAGFDHFHIGGLAATAGLARRAGVTAEMRVLDAGSGLGGPSRFLAETFGCRVVGVDLTPSYVRVARLLAERAGLAGKVEYHTASITDLPFPEASFDLVWTQHVVMNVPDRDRLYREFRRVLAPGGRLAFFDPVAADSGETPHYPVPWAETASASTLLTRGETMAALERARLPVRVWDDVTASAADWLAPQQAAAAPDAGRALSLGLVVGARMPTMVANFGRNLAEGRLRLVMGLADAA